MDPRQPSGQPGPHDLASSSAELQNRLLDRPEVTEFLQTLAVLSAALVPGTHCGITLRRDDQVATVASSGPVARRMNEVHDASGGGPCLEAIRTSHRVDVPDTSTESRWDAYGSLAMATGIQSVVSLPISVDGLCLGALNLFASSARAFDEADVARAQVFTAQASLSLTLLLAQARRIAHDVPLREALATTATHLGQALGIVMHAQKIGSHEALEFLRQASRSNNRKLSDVAAEIIQTMTGHPPEPPGLLADQS
jgi:transcriptional regulator with GAF, ATPase, and Fis domain